MPSRPGTAAPLYSKIEHSLLDRIQKEKALKDDEKTELTAKVRYALSGIYVDLNQIDKAADLLKTLLDLLPPLFVLGPTGPAATPGPARCSPGSRG